MMEILIVDIQLIIVCNSFCMSLLSAGQNCL